MAKPLVSIVLGSYNRRAFLEAALESVRANGMDFPYEMIVVDGGSTDGSLNYLAKQKDVITIIQHNRGEWRGKKIERRSWGYFMNLGFKAAQGKYVCMISDDCLLVPDAVSNGVARLEQLLGEGQKVGALAFYWRNMPQLERYCTMKFYGKLNVNHGLYLRSALEEVGWIDETHYQFYCADADLCLRLEQIGYQTASCPDAIVEHYAMFHEALRQENVTSAQTNGDEINFMNRWNEIYGFPADTRLETLASFDYLEFHDPHQTVKKFPRLGPVQFARKIYLGIGRRIKRVLNKFRASA